MERLDKFLCDSGAGTRSQVKQILKAGRVTVDGRVCRDGGQKIDEKAQQICLDGNVLGGRRRVVLMLNKPSGYITATEDKRDKTVMELLPPQYASMEVKPVGRLDKATEGLLLFTNDGELLHCLISPKKQVPKVYYAKHEGTAAQEDVEAFTTGIILADGETCLPAKLEILGAGESRITVCEGKYHQVRRMMASCNLPISYLERQQEAGLNLEGLPRGQVRELTQEEVAHLEEMCQYTQKMR